MELYDLLHPEAVKVVAAASSKKRVLHDMAQLAGNCYDIASPIPFVEPVISAFLPFKSNKFISFSFLQF